MSEIDYSKCYFCDEMIFPIVDGVQINNNDHDGTFKNIDGKHIPIRFHISCLTKSQQQLEKISSVNTNAQEVEE